MSRICTVCVSPQRAEIDAALASGVAIKRHVAQRYGVTPWAIQRHEASHLAPDLIEAARANVSENGTDLSLIGRVTRMVDRLEKLAESCSDYGAGKDLLAAARELRPYHELFGRANGQLASDRINALFVAWGVSSEAEVRHRLELSRTGEVSDQQALDEAEAALKIFLPRCPERITKLRALIDSMSYAEEVTDGNSLRWLGNDSAVGSSAQQNGVHRGESDPASAR